ncbi:MFS transporter [Pseudoglutamicibacter cumminsii]|uniref:MFS transporter n=1 Tax=Pseudoglutamicibacter cumminsii TaxID=156979 RepID=UPI0019596E76|nr:MFS transporter [Pseudoglutamicibacter cumminsii]MBM7796071.1 MFS family permease [Pseudoglutamicibacter cumminsii]
MQSWRGSKTNRATDQPAPERTRQARKAGFAAFIGTTIEWYDFYTYSTAAALVLGPLFFPGELGVLASFATFWVGFLARPLGGVIFGHWGDTFGRKNALITTLLLMGGCTTAVGLLPTYDVVGWWAPAALVVLRLVQGVAMGGEWGGAVVLAAEHAPGNRGILYAAFAQQGSPAGNLCASGVWLLVAMLPDDAFFTWGWRVPFLISAALVAIGLWIRVSVDESPAMMRGNLHRHDDDLATAPARASSTATAIKPAPAGNPTKPGSRARREAPIVTLFREHKAMVLWGVGASVLATTVTYFKATLALSWATDAGLFSRQGFLAMVTAALVVQFCVQPLGALLVHRAKERGRVRRTVAAMLSPEIVLLPLMFVLISTGNPVLALAGIFAVTVPHALYFSALAGLLSESFPPEVRYTGISLSYQVASSVFSGSAPLIGSAMLTMTSGHIWPVAVMASSFAVLTLVSALKLCGSGIDRIRE